VRAVVSQGCRPIGRPLIVTRAERNIVHELGRRPALEVLNEIFEQLDNRDRALIEGGLHLGVVMNEYQERFGRGDFLARNVLGATENGGIAINDQVRVGRTVQFMVHDAQSADEDLRALLADSGRKPKAALLFTCNGRGTRMFGAPHHDVTVVRDVLGSLPLAGFFAMGEIGPVGGQNFLHGFTASLALFE
jgi:small ligand-binding sensory domain FIST